MALATAHGGGYGGQGAWRQIARTPSGGWWRCWLFWFWRQRAEFGRSPGTVTGSYANLGDLDHGSGGGGAGSGNAGIDWRWCGKIMAKARSGTGSSTASGWPSLAQGGAGGGGGFGHAVTGAIQLWRRWTGIGWRRWRCSSSE